MEEQWKTIKASDGRYQISNAGRVRRIANGHILKPSDNGSGYQYVSIVCSGKTKHFYIHRLVAEHFIENKDNCEEVNHIDFNKKNNDVSNLEWCTRRENVTHSVSHMKGRRHKKCYSNTGELYISRRKNGRYRLTIDKKEYLYKSLEEAIQKRTELLGALI